MFRRSRSRRCVDFDFDSLCQDYLSARLHTPGEVLSQPCPVPQVPGVYGWWFRQAPPRVPTTGCVQRHGATLLYAGISPKQPPTNGRPPSRQNLRKRIRQHLRGNAAVSTLRLTLGVLLGEDLDIELRCVGSGARRTFGPSGEAALSEWIADNAQVSWVSHPEPWKPEQMLTDRLNLPLNLQGNAHSAFHSELTRLRADAALRARQLPVLVRT
ncbi:GIY-YIG nuclease family protein [Mycobacterium sp. NBC_00419]|uniref:GIY-YIG nuclease family protein n=1 Tax=Mycobacterium sp. NBC_00419 TaxID=2975989 RepID=UPI002E1F0967